MKTLPADHRPFSVCFAVTWIVLMSSVDHVIQAQVVSFDLNEATISQMQTAMGMELISSEYLVQQYLKRIEAFDDQGPALNSVIALNPDSLASARELDSERQTSGPRGPMHGIPVLLKDNIDTFDLPTTAGALVLDGSIPPDDAFLTKKLRDAGAIILGKANLSEFANFVSFDLPNGFSALGGQTLNPYGPGDFDPFGSSAGSAVAVAANLASVAVGTETQGSIISPASINGVVGIRPTLGLISRDGIVPITFSQDTAGPIARTVADASVLLGAMAGVDPNDPATTVSAGQIPDSYTQFLNPAGLKGKRLGVVRNPVLQAPDFIAENKLPLVENAIAAMQEQGAIVVDDLDLSTSLFGLFDLWGDDLPAVLSHEFVPALEGYLASLGDNAPVKTLAEIVAFNDANAAEAIPFGQSILEASLATEGNLESPTYVEQLEAGVRLMAAEGLDVLMETNNLDALVFSDTWSALGAVPGYPSISVPAGFDDTGLPASIEFLGLPFSEPDLIEIAFAFEQATGVRVPPTSTPAIEGDLVIIPEPTGAVLTVVALASLSLLPINRRPIAIILTHLS